jgi:hypothetical protein
MHDAAVEKNVNLALDSAPANALIVAALTKLRAHVMSRSDPVLPFKSYWSQSGSAVTASQLLATIQGVDPSLSKKLFRIIVTEGIRDAASIVQEFLDKCANLLSWRKGHYIKRPTTGFDYVSNSFMPTVASKGTSSPAHLSPSLSPSPLVSANTLNHSMNQNNMQQQQQQQSQLSAVQLLSHNSSMPLQASATSALPSSWTSDLVSLKADMMSEITRLLARDRVSDGAAAASASAIAKPATVSPDSAAAAVSNPVPAQAPEINKSHNKNGSSSDNDESIDHAAQQLKIKTQLDKTTTIKLQLELEQAQYQVQQLLQQQNSMQYGGAQNMQYGNAHSMQFNGMPVQQNTNRLMSSNMLYNNNAYNNNAYRHIPARIPNKNSAHIEYDQ